MFKKMVLSIVIAASASQAVALEFNEHTDSFNTQLQKEIMAWVYYGKGLLLISPITEFFDRREAKSQVIEALDDAQFFQEHVVSAQKGESFNLIYQNMVIRVRPGEVVTRSEQINERSNALHDVLVDSSSGIVTTDAFDAPFYKINGRILISDKLNEAHMAAVSLINRDIIKAPESLGQKAKYIASSNAVILNNLMVEYALKH